MGEVGGKLDDKSWQYSLGAAKQEEHPVYSSAPVCGPTEPDLPAGSQTYVLLWWGQNSGEVVANFATTAKDGKSYQVAYCAQAAVIAVGYRVKSHRGTQFRIWATGVLKDYAQKGFAMDDVRLKQAGGGVYFDELLPRIRDIRFPACPTSRFWVRGSVFSEGPR